MGAYWLCPSSMLRWINLINSSETLKSGKPCDKLIAPCSKAIRDITVKMDVPTSGRRGFISFGLFPGFCLVERRKLNEQFWLVLSSSFSSLPCLIQIQGHQEHYGPLR